MRLGHRLGGGDVDLRNPLQVYSRCAWLTVSGLDVVGLSMSGLDVVRLSMSGLDVVGLSVAGLDVAGLSVAVLDLVRYTGMQFGRENVGVSGYDGR